MNDSYLLDYVLCFIETNNRDIAHIKKEVAEFALCSYNVPQSNIMSWKYPHRSLEENYMLYILKDIVTSIE